MKIVGFIFLICILVGIPINLISNTSYDAGWTIGEWLVSYQGGFIRRGLSGSIIYTLTNNFNINPIFLIWTISLVLYISLFLLVYKYCKFVFPKYLLFSPIFLGFPAINNNLIRKDNLLLLAFCLCIFLIELYLNKKITKFYTFCFTNFISIIAILNHESYGFWALPILILLIAITKNKIKNSLFSKIKSALYFLLPSTIIFILCCLFKGNQEQVNIIHFSWRKFYPLLPSPGNEIFLPQPTGTMSSLAWKITDSLKLTLSTFSQFSKFVWIPAAWLITIFISSLYFINSISQKKLIELKSFVLISEFLIFTPLFIMGVDYGRWIYLWIISSAMVVSFIERNQKINLSLHPIYKIYEPLNKFYRNFPFIHKTNIYSYLLLFFGIPGCCWSIFKYIQSTPIGYLTLCNSLYCPLKNMI